MPPPSAQAVSNRAPATAGSSKLSKKPTQPQRDLLVLVEGGVDAGADPADRAAVPVGDPQGHLLVLHGRMPG